MLLFGKVALCVLPAIYHRLFSHPEMVADLLRNFLAFAILAALDLSQMRRMNTKVYGPEWSTT